MGSRMSIELHRTLSSKHIDSLVAGGKGLLLMAKAMLCRQHDTTLLMSLSTSIYYMVLT